MKKRYEELDVLRGMAIIGVILIHITSELIDAQDNLGLFINQAARFAVPVFLILSGLGLTLSNKINQGYFNFLWKQLSKIILLYFIWSVIYYTATSESYSILGFIKGFILGANYYHLYYVPIIIFLYFIYPLLLKLAKNIYGLATVLLVTVLSQLADILTGIEIFNNPLNVFNWVFYFALGIWLAHNFETKFKEIKRRKVLIAALFTTMLFLLLVESYFLKEITSMRPSVILYSVLFVLLVLSVNWKNNVFKNLILKLSGLSYGIYLSHAIVLTIYEKVYKELGFSWNSMLYIIITFIVVALLSIVLTVIGDKVMLVINNIFVQETKQNKA